MKSSYLLMLGGMIILLSIVAVSGTMVIPMSENGKAHTQAPEHSPVIDEGYNLERIDFVHYAKPDGIGKPPSAVKPPKVDTCYKLMGISWKSLPVVYTINPTNGDGLTESFVTTAISTGAETWDYETSKELFFDSYTIDDTATYGIQDFKNAITFDTKDADGKEFSENIIAITSVWWSPRGRQIVEFDMVFNDKWLWGDADSGTFMDVQNIATHEMGHAVGLADLYTDSCKDVTMYGYSGVNETLKRTLEQPDIDGLISMYGL